MRRCDPSSRWWIVSVALAIAFAYADRTPAQQIVPGTNVNMVSGTSFVDGDPFLQRQNEPSSAVSTRNPEHILAGSNDYRTVDIPFSPADMLRPQRMNADAWVGLFKSVNGGHTWTSSLVPGFPQDESAEGLASPLKVNTPTGPRPHHAATDAVVRAGTNGMFYYAGLAFDRGDGAPSKIFVARYMDLNNVEAGDPISYLNTTIVDQDAGARFLDKTALATDIPRTTARCTFNVPVPGGAPISQNIPAGNVYVAYTAFTGTGATEQSQILISRSTDCGATWGPPRMLSAGSRLVQNAAIAVSPSNGHVYVSWRRFRYTSQDDAIMVARSTDGGLNFGKPVRVAGVRPFDQLSTTTAFRTNGFQTMAIDQTGRVYIAWSERGHALERSDLVTGDARVVISSSTNSTTWTVPRPVQREGFGHQVMPALTFHAGKLRLLYYDLREDVSGLFQPFVDEAPILDGTEPPVRHTMDVFVAQALPGVTPVFTTARLSDYAFGFVPGAQEPQRLQYNPPNLPLFKQGTTPFMGDYIDLAPSPAYIQNPDGSWSHNTAPGSAVSHAFWADNRDVRPPPPGRSWEEYTPVTSAAIRADRVSRFDPTATVPECDPSTVGMRDQNIYTARVTEGLFVSAPGNNKPLEPDFARGFVVTAENATNVVRAFRMTIDTPPPGTTASFLQFTPLTQLVVNVPAFSTIARTVFASSSNERTRITVSIVEVDLVTGAVVPNGLTGQAVLNPDPDPQSPRLQSPRLQSPRLQSPLIAEEYNAGITNAVFAVPRLQSPRLQSPTIVNPRLQSDSLGNPRLQSDTVANPGVVSAVGNTSAANASIANPRLQSPRLQSTGLDDAEFTDTSWEITNDGNVTAAYTINLVLNEAVPAGFVTQLLVHKTFMTPAADGCRLTERPTTTLVANIPDPVFVSPTNPAEIGNPRLQSASVQNPTLALAPDETATITLRVVDPNRFDGVEYDASAAVIPAAVAQSVNTEDAGVTQQPSVAIPLTITTATVPTAGPGQPYTANLNSFGAFGGVTCSLLAGQLPPGLSLGSNGTITGTPTTPGNYEFTVRCTDTAGNFDDQTLSLQVDPTIPAGFTASWNGSSTDWADPDNWSPRGVPGPTARVYISASIPVIPRLTRNETIRDLFIEPGATVDTNGFRLTITGNAEAGHTIIGSGTTVLSGDGGTASGVFSNVEITGRTILSGAFTATGNLTLANGARLYLNGQSLIVGGQLVTTDPGESIQRVIPAVYGPSATFIVSGVSVDGLLLQNAPLTIDGGVLSMFDDVSLHGFAPEAVQLTVNHPGNPDSFMMSGLTFTSVPTTGRLIQANDTNDGANTLVIDVFGAVPADGAANTATAGGAVVNWLSNPGDANLAVVQSVSPNPAVAGSVLTYTIYVTNGGPAGATNVSLSPGVPFGTPGGVLSTTQGSCSTTSGNYSCQLGNIPAGSMAVVTAQYVRPAAGTFVTVASVQGGSDSSEANNSHAIAVTVVGSAQAIDLSLTKTASAPTVAPNTPFTYTLTVANTGSTAATDVTVVDPIPSGLTIASATPSQGACTIAAGQVVCQLGTVAGSSSVTITLAASATATGFITNTAYLTASGVDLNPGDNIASQSTMVVLTEGCSAVAFSGPVSFQGSPGPTAVVRLVDMNHDGHLDAVATHESNGGGVDVFLNDGTGQFAVPPRFTSTVTGPWIHVVADFNGDTHPDVVTSTDREPGAQFTTLRLLTNNGSGTLTLVPTFSIPFGGHLDAHDMDRDGDMDLVIASATSDDLQLVRNDGAGNFAPPVTLVAGNSSFSVFADFNGDAHTDIAGPQGAAGYAVSLADGSGGFLPPVVHPVVGGAVFVSTADFNGDGRLDLLIAEGEDEDAPSGQASVALGDGAGGFGAPVAAASGGFFFVPTLTDVTGDGRVDLVALASFNSLGVWVGNGAGGFSTPVHFANASYYWPTVGDVNGDGRPDIVTGDRAGQLNVFFNNCGAAAANLRVAVSESADPVNEGDELTYTVTVTNLTGNEATGVRLRSVLSPETGEDPEEPNVAVLGVTSSAGGTLTTAGSTYTWTLPTLGPNASATFTFRFRPLAGATLLFTTGVTSDGAETDSSDNTASESTVVNAASRTIVVTNTNDSGPGSLRQAINESNSDTGDVDRIHFSIGDGGARTIIPLTALPVLDEPAIIDGTTQLGFSGAPLIELNGNGLSANGLVIRTGTTVRGLVINRFGQSGIFIGAAPGASPAGGNVVEGNYLGVDLAGAVAQPNNQGVTVFSSSNRIGGTTAAARNILSGNQNGGVALVTAGAAGNEVQGNYVGTDVSGTAPVPNGGTGGAIRLNSGATGNTVTGNVVSGNTSHGIGIAGATTTGNVVQANFVGTDPTGMVRVANGGIGIDIVSAQNTLVGGLGAGRNVISGNGTGIQIRTNASGNRIENNYIGVNAAGTAAISNGTGVLIQDAANGNTIGSAAAGRGNVISGSTGSGIRINTNATGTLVLGNRIGTNEAGTAALSNQTGVNITAPGNTVAGNLISSNLQNGVLLGVLATGNTIQGNLIGTDVLGALDLGNGVDGVQVEGTGNLIGGTGTGARNVISGNQSHGVQIRPGASGNTVVGNYIGLNIAGTLAIGNGAYGVTIFGPNNTVGGTAAGAGNVLSGNGLSGVNLGSGANPPATGNQILGNRIGTNAAGLAAVPNVGQGVIVFEGPNTIGGNLISGNLENGVSIADGIGVIVRGNLIGTNATGTSALPNGNHGVWISSGAQATEVGGTVAGEGNVISGNTWDGVSLTDVSTSNNLIRGNLIGTNAMGTAALGNRRGVVIGQGASANTVGGSTPGARNVISGNTDGILLTDFATTDNSITGNYIGTNIDATAAVPNLADGIAITGARDNVIGGTAGGAANRIAFNGGNGVSVTSGNGNRILSNSIHDNGLLGINLGAAGVTPNDTGDGDTGANNLQNFPVLTSAASSGPIVTVQGTLNSTPNTTFRIELFNGSDPSGFGEGADFLVAINVTTDGTGQATFTTELPGGVTSLTATATDSSGNTSEFSAHRGVVASGPQTFVVTNTSDSGAGSLRQAILSANASTGTLDTISFNILGEAPFVITPATPLPAITDPVTIDATTQSGAAGGPVVELNGINAGATANGLVISAGGSTVRGLVIYRFGTGGATGDGGGAGIVLQSGNNVVEGNHLGTNREGTLAQANRAHGVRIDGSSNRIGGPSAGQRNIIGGSDTGIAINGGTNTVQGNYIGLDANGTTSFPGHASGIVVSGADNIIGGSEPGAGNAIWGYVAVEITGAGSARNRLEGNRINTNAAGTAVLGAHFRGVVIASGASQNVIGGAVAGAGNVIGVDSADTGTLAVEIAGDNNLVAGNRIGINASGSASLGGRRGVRVTGSSNRIGGQVALARNIISGSSGTAIEVTGAGAVGTVIEGNYIGLDTTGSLAVANGTGIIVGPGAEETLIGGVEPGAGNVISGNTGPGIFLQANSSATAILGNVIGLDFAGNIDRGNGGDGIIVAAEGALIGGFTEAARNLISGNSANGIRLTGSGVAGAFIRGNYIGTRADGGAGIGNSSHGISIEGGAHGNTIGGTESGAGNLISGNTGHGINIFGPGVRDNVVAGNRIGTDPDATTAIANGFDGIAIQNAAANTIGGLTTAARNIISGNTASGITISGLIADGNRVLNNLIGTNNSSTSAIANRLHGVIVSSAPNTEIRANVTSGNLISGVAVFGAASSGTLIRGNWIGSNIMETGAVPNGGVGVRLDGAANVVVGGVDPADRNRISGNGQHGVALHGGATANVIQGNTIGGVSAGIGTIGNALDGLQVFDGSNNTIGGTSPGQANVIQHNARNGVAIVTGTGNRIAGNSISDNGALGIDLGLDGVTNNDALDADEGPNDRQNFPVLTSAAGNGVAATVQGTLNSTPDTTFRIELFTGGTDPSGNGEGATLLAAFDVTTDGAGTASFSTEVTNPGSTITATATSPGGNTSEFSANRAVVSSPTIAATDGDAAELGNNNGTLLISRPSGEPTTSPRFVQGTIGGTAVPGADYSLSAPVPGGVAAGLTTFELTIPAGQTSVTVTVTPVFNAAQEGSENAVFTLEGTTATVTIADEPAATVATGDGTAAESGGDTGTFVVTRGGDATYARFVQGTIAGGAVPGADYSLSASVPGGIAASLTTFELTIPAGQTSVTVTVTPVADAAQEGTEDALFTLEGTSAAIAILDAPQVRSWIRDADGAWEDQNNWSGGVVPQPGDIVDINRPAGDFVITIDEGDYAVAALHSEERIAINGASLFVAGTATLNGGLTLEFGTLAGAGDLMLGGTSLWTGGLMAGPGATIVTAGAQLTVSSPGDPGVLNRSILNDGTLIWNQPTLALANGAQITNRAGGVFEIQSNLTIDNASSGVTLALTNAGRLFKTGSLGPLTLNGVRFVNTGLLELRIGDDFDQVVANAGAVLGGTLSVVNPEGFVPVPGTQYEVLQFNTSDGEFATLNGNGQSYELAYDDTTVTLTALGGVVTHFESWQGAATGSVRLFDFEGFATGTILTGDEYQSRGVMIAQRSDDAMRIAEAGDGSFVTAANMASPTHGMSSSAWPGFPAGLDDDRSDNFDLFFAEPVPSAGVWIGNLNPGLSSVTVEFRDAANQVIHSFSPVTTDTNLVTGGGGPLDNRLFVGLHSSTPIARVRILNLAGDGDGIVIDDIVVVFDNTPPVANAGSDQSINAGDTVQLNGENSFDADDQSVTYRWRFDSRPDGSAASLSDASSQTPTFVADVPGTYTVELIVNDGIEDSELDLVEIHTNAPPIADAGPDQEVPEDALVELDGSGSSDPESSDLTFHWILNTRPAGSTAQLSSTTIVHPTFVADIPGVYIAQLVVNDGQVNSDSDLVRISTANRAPIANAGPDQSNVPLNVAVTLDGSQSSDPDLTIPSLSWTFVSRPPGSTAVLLSPNTAAPSFTPDRTGRYRINLVASDGFLASSDNVDVTTVNTAPTANAGPDQTVNEGVLVTLNGTSSTDPEFTPLTYAWTIVTRPAGSTVPLTGPTTSSPTFTPDRTGNYVIGLVVNDGLVDSAQDTVSITVLSSTIMMSLVDTPLVGVNRDATLRVTLPWAAPAGGVSVAIETSDANILTVTPTSVTIPEGQTTADVTVHGQQAGTVTLTATALGYAEGELQVSVTQNILTVPATANVALGGTASFPVTIPAPAPAGGLVITLTSSNPSAVELVTGTVTIPQGAFGANGTIRGIAIGTSTVTASRTGFSSASSSAATTAQLNIIDASFAIRPAFPRTITIRLESAGSAVAAPAPGVEVTLVSGNPACVTTNGPVTIPTGVISVQATVSYGGSATLPCTTTLRAQSPGVTPETINVTVNPAPEITLSSPTASVGSGLQYGAFGGQLGESNHGGATVTLTSSNAALMRLSRNATTAGAASIDIPVSNGQTSFTYYIHGMEGQTGDATVTASEARFASDDALVHVVQPAVEFASAPSSLSSLDPNVQVQVRVGLPVGAPANSFISPAQAVRIGGTALSVTVTNSNATAARLTTTAGSAQSRTVDLVPGEHTSSSSVAAGGMAFDPLAPGTTVIAASAPGFLSVAGATRTVMVTAPSLSFSSTSASVGSGLQYGAFGGSVSGSQHGGIDVVLTSEDPAIMRVSPNATTAGTASISIHLNNGQTSFTYYIHGMEGRMGDAKIFATSTGFVGAETQVHVVQPAIELVSVPATMSSFDPNVEFRVRVGLLVGQPASSFISPAQAVRIGAPGNLIATVTNGNAAAARLVTLEGPAQSRTVAIQPGESLSANAVATGGIALDAIGGGTTQVAASIPGFAPTASATKQVSVTAPALTLSSPEASVGSGLQYGAFGGQLGGSQHGGVDVILTSPNPAVLRLSPDANTAGAASISIHLNNGVTSFTYYIHGMEGQTGDVTITATAEGFTGDTALVHVVQPAIELVSVPATMTSLAPNSEFRVRIGLLVGQPASSFISPTQAIRTGGSPLTVTIANGSSSVAQLTTLAGTAQTRTVTIAVGDSTSPTTVATGGIAIDPIGGGTTIITATASGYQPTAAASQQVVVSAPAVSLSSATASVGSGLQYGAFGGTLGGSQHGGVNVTLTSSNPAIMRISPDAATEGQGSIQIHLTNGQTSFTYYVHGMENRTGGVTLTASAPGFTDDTATVEVVTPAIELVSVPTSISSLAPNTEFRVRVGLLAGSPAFSFISPAQAIRIGGSPVTATITNSASAVARLTTTAGSAQSRTVIVPVGDSTSPFSVATGGIAFDPLTPGSTQVVVQATGFLQTVSAAQDVTVTPAHITISSPTATVGAGLQYGAFGVSLDGSQHPGVTVTLTSADPSVLLLSPNATTTGTASIQFPLATGQTSFTYYIQGVEGRAGNVTITASAPGFVSDTATVDVLQAGVQIESLATTLNATDPTTVFFARVGVLNASGTGLAIFQNPRFGTSLTATVTNSNGTAAQLVTSAGGAQSRTTVIHDDSSRSPNTIAAGGVAFDPLATGMTTVTVTIPGFHTVEAGVVTVEVR